MSDQNISEKISNVITNIIKRPLDKLNVFIKISTGLFMITTTVTVMNYYYIKNLDNKNDEQINLLNDNNVQLAKIIDQNYFITYNVYKEIQTKLDRLLEISIESQKQNNTLLQRYEKTHISTLTSMSDFEKYSRPEIFHCNDNEENDNELLHECYDMLPCNNIKKATSHGFFWK
jgi:hypothetical protein